jgi:glyoxylase-like metal-dependent hydrolase (beta-lactamase superfamily II)
MTTSWRGGDIAPGVRCVLAENPGPMTLDGTNSWVLGREDSNSCLVVDPGPRQPEHLRRLDDAVAGRAVAAVVLTHSHLDHSEAAAGFAAQHRADVLAGDDAEQVVAAAAHVGLPIEVVTTPGHTADSACFLLADEGMLLTGDTVLGRGTSVVAYPDGRLGDYLDSLQRLAGLITAYGVTRVLPGHGPVSHSPRELVSFYLDHRRQRLVEVQTSLADGADSVGAVVADVYRDVDRSLWSAAGLSVRAQLEYLVASSREHADQASRALAREPLT